MPVDITTKLELYRQRTHIMRQPSINNTINQEEVVGIQNGTNKEYKGKY